MDVNLRLSLIVSNNVILCLLLGKNGGWENLGNFHFSQYLRLILDPPLNLINTYFPKCGFTLVVALTWYWVWSARDKWIFEGNSLSLDHLSAKLHPQFTEHTENTGSTNELVLNVFKEQFHILTLHSNKAQAWSKP